MSNETDITSGNFTDTIASSKTINNEHGFTVETSASLLENTEDAFLFGKPLPEEDFSKTTYTLLPKAIAKLFEDYVKIPFSDESLRVYDIVLSRIFDITSSFHGQELTEEVKDDCRNLLATEFTNIFNNSPDNSPLKLFNPLSLAIIHFDDEHGTLSLQLDSRFIRMAELIRSYNNMVRTLKEEPFSKECPYPTFMTLTKPSI